MSYKFINVRGAAKRARRCHGPKVTNTGDLRCRRYGCPTSAARILAALGTGLPIGSSIWIESRWTTLAGASEQPTDSGRGRPTRARRPCHWRRWLRRAFSAALATYDVRLAALSPPPAPSSNQKRSGRGWRQCARHCSRCKATPMICSFTGGGCRAPLMRRAGGGSRGHTNPGSG